MKLIGGVLLLAHLVGHSLALYGTENHPPREAHPPIAAAVEQFEASVERVSQALANSMGLPLSWQAKVAIPLLTLPILAGLISGLDWLTNCDPRDPTHECAITNRSLPAIACTSVACYLLKRHARKGCEKQAHEHLRLANGFAHALVGRADEVRTLELARRKRIFLKAALIGNVVLMQAIRSDDNPVEAQILRDLTAEYMCSICCSNFHEDDMILLRNRPVRRDCGHIFHSHCLRRWYKVKATCPNCRDAEQAGYIDLHTRWQSLIQEAEGHPERGGNS